MAKKSKKTNDDEIEDVEVEEEETEEPEAVRQAAPGQQEEQVPGPGMEGSLFGQTSQLYDGEADPATIIKARNKQRVYEQAGVELPPLEVNETPVVTSIAPTEAEIGGSDVELVVTGEFFSFGSAIVFNGGIEPTTLNSDTEATTIVKPSLASTPGSYPVLVRNAAGIESNAVDFTFTEAPPVRSSKKGKKSEDDDE